MIVVDASIVAFLLIEGELTPAARRLHRLDPEWITPPILNHELLHILAALGHSSGSQEDRRAMVEIWRGIRQSVGARQQVPDPVKALKLAMELGIPGHDAQYLALAEQLALPLVTEEESLIAAAPSRAVGLISYLGRIEEA